MSPDPLAQMAAELRALRSCFGDYRNEQPNSPGGWSAAIYNYDIALVRVADLLDVAGAPDPDYVVGRRRLTDFERAHLEEQLAEAGVEVRPPRAIGSKERSQLALPSGRSSSGRARADGPLGLPVAPPAQSGPSARTGRRTDARRSATTAADTGSADTAGSGPGRSVTGRATGNGEAASRHRAGPRRRSSAGQRIGRLAADARALRRRLAEYRTSGQTWPTKVAEWSADLDTYDETILALADMLEVPSPVPPGARRRLLAEDRARLERELAEAGADLGLPSQEASAPR